MAAANSGDAGLDDFFKQTSGDNEMANAAGNSATATTFGANTGGGENTTYQPPVNEFNNPTSFSGDGGNTLNLSKGDGGAPAGTNNDFNNVGGAQGGNQGEQPFNTGTSADLYLNRSFTMLPDFIRGARHPKTCFFHVFFKALCLFTYFFGSWFFPARSATLLTYIFCILFLAFDFWTVKNVTGRLLVGLRWWSVPKVDPRTGEEIPGADEWHFESLESIKQANSGAREFASQGFNLNLSGGERTIDPLDRNVFWFFLMTWPGVWALLLLYNMMLLKMSWVVFLVAAEVFACTNLYGFWMCSSDQRKKGQQMMDNVTGAVQGAMFKQMGQKMMGGLFGGGKTASASGGAAAA